MQKPIANAASPAVLHPGMPPQSHIEQHIELIARHEKEFLSRRTWDEVVGDRVSGLVGSLSFVSAHVILLLFWVFANTDRFSFLRPFDPPPFSLLDTILAFESILLVSFILMRQSRIARRTDERNHLELQLMLLTEKELTATLSVCREIAGRIGLKEIANDRELHQMVQDTPVDELAQTIREKLPNE